MRDLPLLGISRMTHGKGEKGHENKAINKQKPTNTQNIHPTVFLHPSNINPKINSNPFIIQPNSPPPTKRRTIKIRIPITENISINIISFYFHILVLVKCKGSLTLQYKKSSVAVP